jgi:hypothetical protein
MLSRGPTWPAVSWDASYPARTTCHCASMMLSPDDIDRIANTDQGDFTSPYVCGLTTCAMPQFRVITHVQGAEESPTGILSDSESAR